MNKRNKKSMILIGGRHTHNYYTLIDEDRLFSKLDLLNQKFDNMANNLAELKAKIEKQQTALASIDTSVAGIKGDVKTLKDKITELQAGQDEAVNAALAELSPLVDAVGTKIDEIGATTASLDAETDAAPVTDTGGGG